MAGERKLVWKVCLGIIAGLISVGIINMLGVRGFYVAWAEIVGAALIGAVAGIAEGSGKKIVLGIVLGCIGFWCAGWVPANPVVKAIATWPIVGGFIGLSAGILEKSVKSIIVGIILGAVGGLIGALTGILALMADQLANFMQAMMLVGVGLFISLLLGLKRPPVAVAAVAGSEEDQTAEAQGEV